MGWEVPSEGNAMGRFSRVVMAEPAPSADKVQPTDVKAQEEEKKKAEELKAVSIEKVTATAKDTAATVPAVVAAGAPNVAAVVTGAVAPGQAVAGVVTEVARNSVAAKPKVGSTAADAATKPDHRTQPELHT